MGWYRRTKFAFNSFRNATGSKFPVRNNPVSIPPIARTNGMRFSSTSTVHGNNSTITNQFKPGLSGYSAILSKFGNLGALRQNQSCLFSVASRRNYYVDKRQVSHFRPRGSRRWFQEPRNVLIVVLVGSGAVITFYFGNMETIPYTKRRHFVLLSKSYEMQLGESQFEQVKAQFKGKILPPIHPDSIRVRLIAKDIIESLQRGLSHEQVWSDPGYSSDSSGLEYDQHVDGQNGAKTASSEGAEFKFGGDWKKEGEVLDDKWVKESRSKGKARGLQPATHHLEDLKWEVLVVDDPAVNAFCAPGGKIVVFTGLLDHFRTDAEIATIIGHEVGHAVARHSAEQLTKTMWITIIQMVLFQFVDPNVISTMSNLLLRLPFSRKMEIEADYIGLLLTASAGYDPRVAPMVYQKLGKVGGDSGLQDYLSTHPSGKTRAQLLAKAHVMEEAMALFREARSGRGIEGFL